MPVTPNKYLENTIQAAGPREYQMPLVGSRRANLFPLGKGILFARSTAMACVAFRLYNIVILFKKNL